MRKSSSNGNGKHKSSRAPRRNDPARQMGPRVGMLEWFRPGEHDRVDRTLADLAVLGVTEIRTGISWADACTPEGEDWYAWLLPQLARRVNVLPCFVDTPPGWASRPSPARLRETSKATPTSSTC